MANYSHDEGGLEGYDPTWIFFFWGGGVFGREGGREGGGGGREGGGEGPEEGEGGVLPFHL